MGIVAWIVVGLIAGIIANVIYPGRERGGALGAMMLGIVGAVVGGFRFGVLTGADFVTGINLTSILVSVVGALVLLFRYHAVAITRSRGRIPELGSS
ncbi:MAG: hypothetical protein QOF51_1204, partial [Chloroflexota bacterium]|nr:hypothetical protein [Chloroflexota bacterium]